MAEWISVNDRLPDMGQQVLMVVADDGHQNIFVGSYGWTNRWRNIIGLHDMEWCYVSPYSEGYYVEPMRSNRYHVTHWMPLPEPPKDL